VKQPAPYRAGVHGSEFELLVRSGMFGRFSPAEARILMVLAIFRDPESRVTQLSYQAIMRYSGVRSRANVAQALAKLQELHVIQISRGPRIGITRECSAYMVTLDDPRFYDHCNAVSRIARDEIAQERAYRKELRTARERLSRSAASTPKPTLNTTEGLAGGLRPPDPPFSLSHPEGEENPSTCEGLNLSSSGELKANRSVLAENREIGVLAGNSNPEARRRKILQQQAEKIQVKYGRAGQKPGVKSGTASLAQAG
jgi:hypothetical protein